MRKQLEKLLSWRIGIATDFSVSVGKSGKYMHCWLPEEEWEMYLSTYCGGNVEECWQAVFRMCDLFKRTAIFVGNKLGYGYDMEEGKRCCEFLEHVRKLPEDATEIY